MSRLPFDPDRMAAAKRPSKTKPDEPWSVTQACSAVKRVIETNLPRKIRIRGELSNFSDRKHWYFSLRDDQNVISCAMWQSKARTCGFQPASGMELVATGHFDFYGPQGRIQFYVDRLEHVGVGGLEQRFRELCEQLRAAGKFDDAHKRPMPAFPLKLAIVTSLKGAAVQDVIRTARSRWPGIEMCVFDVRVQGEAAAKEVAHAVRLLSRDHARLGIDAVILTRGGGSLEDLWSFNDQIVADAVFESEVPIAVGVGHEPDTTVAELVADLRCSTPTQAAERLVPDASTESERIASIEARLQHALRSKGEAAKRTLASLASRPVLQRPEAIVTPHRERVQSLAARLTAALRHRASRDRERLAALDRRLAAHAPAVSFAAGRERLDSLERRLTRSLAVSHDAGRTRLASVADRLAPAMNRNLGQELRRLDAIERQLRSVGPKQVLERGYTFTRDAKGNLLRTAAAAKKAGTLKTTFADGELESTVGAGKKRRSKRNSPAADNTLFGDAGA